MSQNTNLYYLVMLGNRISKQFPFFQELGQPLFSQANGVLEYVGCFQEKLGELPILATNLCSFELTTFFLFPKVFYSGDKTCGKYGHVHPWPC